MVISCKKGYYEGGYFTSPEGEIKVLTCKNRKYQEGEVYAQFERLGNAFVLLDTIKV